MGGAVLALTAIVAGAFLLQMANGWLGLLVPARLGAAEYPATVVGIVVTAHSVGFLAGCLVAARIVRQVGHIRAFAALAAAVSVASLAFTIAVEPVLWTLLRLVTGFCSAGLFTIAEAWISAQTPQKLRGRVLSLYMTSNKLAVAGGQLALAAADGGAVFFLLSSAAYSLALIPVALNPAAAPKPPELVTLNLRQLFRIAPAGVVGCFAAGLINTAVTGVLPLYGVELGFGTGTVAVLLALMQAGSFLLQWPLGWSSDRYDRRIVIAGSAVAIAAISLLVGILGKAAPLWGLGLLLLLWGGFALSIYALSLAHAADFADPQEMVPLSSSLLLVWAAGSVIGPALATVAMDLTGPGGLFFYSGLVALLLAGFVVWRMTRRRPLRPEERDRFVAYATTTSPVAAELDPRASENRPPAAIDAED